MPSPHATGTTTPVSAVVALFRLLHQELRLEIMRGRDESLNWVPCPGANSVATIVTHMLGSEAETLCAVADVAHERDRDGEFQMGRQSQPFLIKQVDSADALLDDLESRMTEVRAAILMPLPTLPSDDRRSGLTWLTGNLGHAREHMGHLRLTMQLYEAWPRPR
jgi:hypothetical protein